MYKNTHPHTHTYFFNSILFPASLRESRNFSDFARSEIKRGGGGGINRSENLCRLDPETRRKRYGIGLIDIICGTEEHCGLSGMSLVRAPQT